MLGQVAKTNCGRHRCPCMERYHIPQLTRTKSCSINVGELQMDYRKENEMLKRLLKDGFFWMNFSSRDCDGCCRETSIKFTSLEEFYKEEYACHESADGPFSFTLARQYPDGTHDLNEDFTGGQWETF